MEPTIVPAARLAHTPAGPPLGSQLIDSSPVTYPIRGKVRPVLVSHNREKQDLSGQSALDRKRENLTQFDGRSGPSPSEANSEERFPFHLNHARLHGCMGSESGQREYGMFLSPLGGLVR